VCVCVCVAFILFLFYMCAQFYNQYTPDECTAAAKFIQL